MTPGTPRTAPVRHRDAAGPLGPRWGGLAREPLLDAQQERDLADAMARGDRAARDRLVRANLGLVHAIARHFLGRGLDPDDLAGEGNLGLFRAAERFDPAFGVRFSTYAGHWIRQAIREALTDTSRAIRLPAHLVALMGKWRRAEAELTCESGRTPSFDQVADRLELTGSSRRLVDRAIRSGMTSGGDGDDDAGGGPADQVADGGEGPTEWLERSDAARDLRRRIATRLADREARLISLRFGLDGGEPLTLKEVGARLGMTREGARKLEARAVAKLRV
jgi:RNA polymerase primary sigma factor